MPDIRLFTAHGNKLYKTRPYNYLYGIQLVYPLRSYFEMLSTIAASIQAHTRDKSLVFRSNMFGY